MNLFFLFQYTTLAESWELHTKKVEPFRGRLFKLAKKPWTFYTQQSADHLDDVSKLTLDAILLIVEHFLHNKDPKSAYRLIETYKDLKAIEKIEIQVTDYISLVCQRLFRLIPIEKFEIAQEDFEWAALPPEWLERITLLTGLVYLQEPDRTVKRKSRFWFERLLHSNQDSILFTTLQYLIEYHRTKPDPNSAAKYQQFCKQLQEIKLQEERLIPFHQVLIHKYYLQQLFEIKENQNDKIAENIQLQLTEFQLLIEKNQINIPSLELFGLFEIIPELIQLFPFINEKNTTGYNVLVEEYLKRLHDIIFEDSLGTLLYPNLIRLKAIWLIQLDQNKEAKRLLQDNLNRFRKEENWGAFIENLIPFIEINEFDEKQEKKFELLMGILKNMLDAGLHMHLEFFLTICKYINLFLDAEILKPGVSWIIEPLYKYFLLQEEYLVKVEFNATETGKNVMERYKAEFQKLPKYANFNIRTSLFIHYLQIQLLKTNAAVNQDGTAQEIAKQLLTQLNEATNPASFIRGNWKDFKDIPNEIRNKVINRCVSITKGDLPLAAEHLNLSYRNIRSYISFNEVNRLGFFLEERHTSNRSLEDGIRLLFYDLYLNGSIFEAVFDMPRFLVLNATQGFFSEDLENALTVKPSTAKKYLKIMTDIGIIEATKSFGKKLHYRLNFEKVMRRYAEQKAINI